MSKQDGCSFMNSWFRKCAECKQRFAPAPFHAFKRIIGHKELLFCSYTCLRKWDKKTSSHGGQDMADNKKYYWLKLKRDFFKRHDIRIIEEMEEGKGKDYILFYLKLLVESVDHEGELRFSETIPYTDQMLSVVTNTKIDIVEAAMKVFLELGIIERFDDGTIHMKEVHRMIGSETKDAERKRNSRKADNVHSKTDNVQKCPQNVREVSAKCPTEKEKDKEKENRERNKEVDDLEGIL